MASSQQVDRPEWLDKPEVAVLFSLFHPEEIRFVGGLVRNTLIGNPSGDYDAATTVLPSEVMTRAQDKGIKALPTGIDHGTVTLVIEGIPFEVTTLRRDVETDGRRAVVSFSEDWREDAFRRDFTMNALYMDQHGILYDYFGGVADLQARKVRFIGDPMDRILEDRLRILRFFRFSGLYADELDVAALSVIKLLEAPLDGLSGERIHSELLKILSLPPLKAGEMIGHMEELGVNPAGILSAKGKGMVEASVGLNGHSEAAIWRLAGLSVTSGTAPSFLAEKLRLSRKEEKMLIAAKAAHDRLVAKPNFGACVYYHGQNPTYIAALTLADLAGKADKALACHYSDFPITAKDLLEIGFEQGVALGKALKELESRYVESGFSLSRDQLLKGAEGLLPA